MNGDGGQPVPTADALEQLAYSTYLTRKLRHEMLSPDLLGEPAWDILLLLFSHANHAQQLTAQELANELGIGLNLTERWLGLLAGHGLVVSAGNHAELTETGRAKLTAYLRRQIAALNALLRAAPPLHVVPKQGGGRAES